MSASPEFDPRKPIPESVGSKIANKLAYLQYIPPFFLLSPLLGPVNDFLCKKDDRLVSEVGRYLRNIDLSGIKPMTEQELQVKRKQEMVELEARGLVTHGDGKNLLELTSSLTGW